MLLVITFFSVIFPSFLPDTNFLASAAVFHVCDGPACRLGYRACCTGSSVGLWLADCSLNFLTIGHILTIVSFHYPQQQINVSGTRLYKNHNCTLAKSEIVSLLFGENYDINAAAVLQGTRLVGSLEGCFTSSVHVRLLRTF